jgi:hypothetical protein
MTEEVITDFQCPICFTFYENAQKLLDHFNNDFPQKKDDNPVEYGLQKTLVKICYNLKKSGLWDKVVNGGFSFDKIKYYSEHPL